MLQLFSCKFHISTPAKEFYSVAQHLSTDTFYILLKTKEWLTDSDCQIALVSVSPIQPKYSKGLTSAVKHFLLIEPSIDKKDSHFSYGHAKVHTQICD